jgi:hypothetical protein
MDLTGVRWDPGFDNEAFIRAMATSEQGSWVLGNR